MSCKREGEAMYRDNGNPAWYAIRTRSRHEKLVHQQLASRRVEAFLPFIDRRRRWKDRWKTVSFPLFPGYCFARFSHQDRLRVVTAVGVGSDSGRQWASDAGPRSRDRSGPPARHEHPPF